MTTSPQEMRSATLYAKLLGTLVIGGTYDDLMEYTGLSYHTVMRYCKAMHEEKLVFIEHWERNSRDIPVIPFWQFTLTPRTDARRPRRTKEFKAALARKRRADKRLQASTSAFTQQLPRYKEGSRETNAR